MQKTGPPPNAIELNAEVTKEGWSVYKVKDKFDVTLRVKLVLLKLFLEDLNSEGDARFGVGANLVMTVSVPPELKGEKSTQIYSNEEIAASIVAEDLPFETVKEDWNEYRSAEGIVLGVKPVATTVSRTSKFDGAGDPIYFVRHQMVKKAKVPKEIVETLRKRLGSKSQ